MVVTDANSCFAHVTFTFNDPPGMYQRIFDAFNPTHDNVNDANSAPLTLSAKTSTKCDGSGFGTVTASAFGGTPPYQCWFFLFIYLFF